MTDDRFSTDRTQTAGKARLIAWLFLAIGLIFAAVGAAMLYKTYIFQQTALATTAKVLSVEIIKKRKRDRDGHMKTSITYKPTLRYEDQYGTQHVGAPSITSSSYNFAVGSDVAIAFAPDNPGEMRIDDFLSNWGFGGFFFLFGSVFAVIGWFVGRSQPRKSTASTGAVNRLR